MKTKSARSAFVALIALIGLALHPATAAAAGPGQPLPAGEVVCFFEERHGILTGIRCISFPPHAMPCLKCDAIVFEYDFSIPVHDRLVDGFVLLDRAARDPVNAADLRRAALDQFTVVARAVSGDIVRETGYVERDTGRFVAQHRPGTAQAGADIDAGLRILRAGGIDPDGDPAMPQAMRYFDSAYQRLAGD
jgi:hypothetical protein